MKWKPDWPRAKQNLIRWWNRQDLALCLKAPRPEALSSAAPSAPEDPTAYWTGPAYRLAKAEHEMATTWYAAEAFPCFDTQIGPGSLGTFLGARPRFTHRTVWYEPCIDDPDRYPDIRFDPTHPWFTAHMALIERGIAATDGRYLVGIPDLIENADTLAALRGSEDLLADLIDRPQWVIRRIDQINQAFFEAFDRMYHVGKDEQGGQVCGCFYL